MSEIGKQRCKDPFELRLCSITTKPWVLRRTCHHLQLHQDHRRPHKRIGAWEVEALSEHPYQLWVFELPGQDRHLRRTQYVLHWEALQPELLEGGEPSELVPQGSALSMIGRTQAAVYFLEVAEEWKP